MPAERQPRRWQVLRDAAAQSMAQSSPATDATAAPASGARGADTLGAVMAGAWSQALALLLRRHATPAASGTAARRRRTDVRLVPATLLVWATALAGGWLEPAALAVLCAVLAAVSAALLWPWGRRRMPAPRNFRATAAAALLLAAATAAHTAVASTQRHGNAVADAVVAGASVVVELEVSGMPRRLATPSRSSLSDRWAVPATALVLVFDGRRVDARAGLLVYGGADWEYVRTGERIRTTGRLGPSGADGAAAGMLSVSSAPVRLSASTGAERTPEALRVRFRAAAAGLPGDAKGLLPGMVTGDTGGLDPQLGVAMKTVGMTHLTAVSGANCSLVLGALVLAARSLRLPRPLAAGLALAGLAFFVAMVGPDASVLRAACMGAVGLVALVFGRAGRGLSLLCVASIALLLAAPALASDVGFLLSVLATLGIVLAGRPIMGWLPAAVPRTVAAGIAVPLSAQLFCGPVIVLLQPQFSSYALFANLAAAPLVAPVTLLGTAAVPLVPVAPAVAAVPVAVAGTFASGVAAVARYFADLPGAALPWPEGAFGLATMAVFSVLSLLGVRLATRPAAVWRAVLVLQAQTADFLGRSLDQRRALPSAGRPRGVHGRRGLVDGARRGRLRNCKPTSRRDHQWLLPRPNAPGPRRRRPPPGAT